MSRHGALLDQLAESRERLLEAIAQRTESDFHRALGGDYGRESLVHALARLALNEREGTDDVPEHPLPPQAMHDLARARYHTLTRLRGTADPEDAIGWVETIIERERTLTAWLQSRPVRGKVSNS